MSDSDDDLPILELIKKRKREVEKENVKIKSESSKPKPKPKPSNSNSTSENNSKASKSYGSGRSADFYENTKKGLLVQKLLVRWWYAITWPKPEDLSTPPPGFESLDGFPGVYISTRVMNEFICMK